MKQSKAFITMSGYGFNLQTEKIWPESAESIWELVDQAPTFAASMDEIRSTYAPESPYARAEILESMNFDSPLLALAQILADVIAEKEGIQLVAEQDFADSDNIILAYPLEDGSYKPLTELREKLDPIFARYMYILTGTRNHAPGYIYWNVEVEPKREFFVDTPLGKIKVYSKHEKDCARDYPGVYVDFLGSDGELVPLACVEYDSSSDRLQTCVYGDGADDSPTEVVHHQNLEINQHERALRLINDFCEENFHHGLSDDDLQHPEAISIGFTTVPQDEIFSIQVIADLVNFALRSYIILPTEEECRVLIREDKYDTLKELNDNDLAWLEPDWMYNFTLEQWKAFATHPDGLRCLREKYPAGCPVHSGSYTGPGYDKFTGTVEEVRNDGSILIRTDDGRSKTVCFGYDDFYPVLATAQGAESENGGA